jgi:pilus assembly protein Flp/PilA
MFRIFRRLRKDEDGATAIEYGLVAGIISLVIITTITMAGSKLEAVFSFIGSTLDDPLQN